MDACDAAAATCVNELLTAYCNASGQRINQAKSSVFFSKGCPIGVREEVKCIHYGANESFNEKAWAFKYIKDRLRDKVHGGSRKLCLWQGKKS